MSYKQHSSFPDHNSSDGKKLFRLPYLFSLSVELSFMVVTKYMNCIPSYLLIPIETTLQPPCFTNYQQSTTCIENTHLASRKTRFGKNYVIFI